MIYIDNSATTMPYPEVTELMVKYLSGEFGNPSALYQLGLDAEKAVKRSRRQMEAAMGVPDGRLCFTSCGTEADNMAIFGAVRALRRAGNRIVTSAVEHPAVLECFRRLEEEGFEVVRIGVDSKCRLDMEQLENAIDGKTILVSLMQVNNETGTVFPVDRARGLMRAKGAPGLLHSDCVQSFGKLPLPREADLLAVSGHKIHGPKGAGALWIRKGVNLPAYLLGGGQESGLRSGTENVAAIAGMGLAAELGQDGRGEAMERLGALRQVLMDGFRDQLEDVIINSPEETGEEPGSGCASVLSVTFLGTRGEVLLHTLEQDGICVSTGSACSSNKKGQSHVLEAMGLSSGAIEGTLRFSPGRFNTREEMEEAVEKTVLAVKRFRRLGSFR